MMRLRFNPESHAGGVRGGQGCGCACMCGCIEVRACVCVLGGGCHDTTALSTGIKLTKLTNSKGHSNRNPLVRPHATYPLVRPHATGHGIRDTRGNSPLSAGRAEREAEGGGMTGGGT